MKYGPDVSKVANLLGDPARSNMIMALMSGHSISATELAREAGVTPSTATGHLHKLESSGLIASRKQGRHRYFCIADPDVAEVVESLIAVATRVGHFRKRSGPKDLAMRHARSCYDHLAGGLAVDLFEHWVACQVLYWGGDVVHVTDKGSQLLVNRSIDMDILRLKKRPICRTCIDWSERQHHLGGSLGAAVLAYAVNQGWATREQGSRLVSFGTIGEKKFINWYSS